MSVDWDRAGKRTYLVVVEGNTEDIGEEQDDLRLVVITRWCGNVRLDTADLLDLALDCPFSMGVLYPG